MQYCSGPPMQNHSGVDTLEHMLEHRELILREIDRLQQQPSRDHMP
jgi:hypothetical protein